MRCNDSEHGYKHLHAHCRTRLSLGGVRHLHALVSRLLRWGLSGGAGRAGRRTVGVSGVPDLQVTPPSPFRHILAYALARYA